MNQAPVQALPPAAREDHVRIGPISVFALIIIVCMAVLAVLTISTAHASLVLSERQALATQELYLDEMLASAEKAADGRVSATASVSSQQVSAEFACENGRTLKIAVTVLSDGTYRIDKWKMTAVENEEQPMGNLYTGA